MRCDRLNIYLDHHLAVALGDFAAQRRLKKSAVVAAALNAFLSPDSADVREAAISKRFDRLTQRLDKLDNDVVILTEATAMFIRYYLSIVTPLAESQQDAARAQGKLRFQQFIEQLARHLQRGNSLARDIHDELYPDSVYAHAAADTQDDAATGADHA